MAASSTSTLISNAVRDSEEKRKLANEEKEAEEAWKPLRGNTVWVPDAKQAWKKSVVYEVTEDHKVKTEDGWANIEDVFPVNPANQDGVPGMFFFFFSSSQFFGFFFFFAKKCLLLFFLFFLYRQYNVDVFT
jgi:hypothetical protein